jgi:hypothetical protein
VLSVVVRVPEQVMPHALFDLLVSPAAAAAQPTRPRRKGGRVSNPRYSRQRPAAPPARPRSVADDAMSQRELGTLNQERRKGRQATADRGAKRRLYIRQIIEAVLKGQAGT